MKQKLLLICVALLCSVGMWAQTDVTASFVGDLSHIINGGGHNCSNTHKLSNATYGYGDGWWNTQVISANAWHSFTAPGGEGTGESWTSSFAGEGVMMGRTMVLPAGNYTLSFKAFGCNASNSVDPSTMPNAGDAVAFLTGADNVDITNIESAGDDTFHDVSFTFNVTADNSTYEFGIKKLTNDSKIDWCQIKNVSLVLNSTNRSYIANNSTDGWSDGVAVNSGSVEGCNDNTKYLPPFIQVHVGSGSTLANGTYQKSFTPDQNGFYRVNAWVRLFKESSGQTSYSGASMFAGAKSVSVCSGGALYNSNKAYLGTYSAKIDATKDVAFNYGFTLSSANFNWLAFKNITIEKITMDEFAETFSNGSTVTANTWYKFTTGNSSDAYTLSSNGDATITYTTDGTLSDDADVSDTWTLHAKRNAVLAPNTTYYIKSNAAVTLTKAETSVNSSYVSGWTKVASISDLQDSPEDYFFAIFSANNTGLILKNRTNANDEKPSYATAANPLSSTEYLYEIENYDGQFALKSVLSGKYYENRSTNNQREDIISDGPWNYHADLATKDANCKTTLNWVNNAFVIQTANKDGENNYLGLWYAENNNNGYVNNEILAGNKPEIAKGSFLIYRIAKSNLNLTSRITNPDFSAGTWNTGWNGTGNNVGTAFKKQTDKDGFPGTFAEMWVNNGNMSSGNLNQTINNLPQGVYTLSVKAQSGIPCYLYATKDEIQYYEFSGTAATRSLSFVLNTTGNVTIGLKHDGVSSASGAVWVAVDDFTLTYKGSSVGDVAAAFTSGSAAASETWYAFTVPSDGWYTITPSAAGTFSYTQNGAIGSTIKRFYALTTGKYQYLTAGTFYFKTNTAATVTIAATSISANDDVTGYINDPSFEHISLSNNGTSTDMLDWSRNSNAGEAFISYKTSNRTFSTIDGNNLFNTWQSSGTPEGGFYLKQTLLDLPIGKYELKCYVASDGDATVNVAFGTSDVDIACGTDKTVGHLSTVELINTSASDVLIAVTSDDWFKADDFKLKYLGHCLVNDAVDFTSGTSAAAGAWKAFTIGSDGYYKISSSAAATLSYSQNGEELVSESFSSVVIAAEGHTVLNLSAGTFYFKSDATSTITIETLSSSSDTDVTNNFITNPSFETGSYTGWSLNVGTGTESNREDEKMKSGRLVEGGGDYYFAYWTNSPTGSKVYQMTSSLPTGTYKLSAYLIADTGTTLTLKAGDVTNTSIAADGNAFPIEVYFTIESSQAIEIAAGTTSSRAWYNMDDFQLTYNPTMPELTPETGKMASAVASAQETAISTYESSKTANNLNAALDAIADAKASKAIYATLNSTLTTYDSKAALLDGAGRASYASNIATVQTAYDDGTYNYSEATAAIETIKPTYVTAVKAQVTAGAIMTDAIVNPSFETGDTDGWDYEASQDHGAKRNDIANYTMSGVDGEYLFNIWDAGNAISQTVTGLPAGTYRLTAVMATDASKTLNLHLGDADGSASSVNKSTGVEVSVEYTLPSSGSITISANASDSYWYKIDNFQLTYVGLNKEVTVAAKAGKYGTVILPFTYDFADDAAFSNITFYSCASVEDGYAQIAEVTTLKANKPYIIKNNGGEDFSKTISGYSVAVEDSYTEGLLTGVYTNAYIPNSDGEHSRYVLQTKDGVQAFYKVEDDDFPGTPYKCYLTIPAATPVKAFLFPENPTAINAIEAARNENAEIYNLAGQRLSKAQKGVNIINGKKVLVK